MDIFIIDLADPASRKNILLDFILENYKDSDELNALLKVTHELAEHKKECDRCWANLLMAQTVSSIPIDPSVIRKVIDASLEDPNGGLCETGLPLWKSFQDATRNLTKLIKDSTLNI